MVKQVGRMPTPSKFKERREIIVEALRRGNSLWGAFIQITALTCASSRSAVLVSQRLRRLGRAARPRKVAPVPDRTPAESAPRREGEESTIGARTDG